MIPDGAMIYLIYENAAVNAHVPEGVEDVVTHRTPRYSPFFNPAEMAHSVFKGAVKLRKTSVFQLQARVGGRSAARAAGVNLQTWRAKCPQEVAGPKSSLRTRHDASITLSPT